MSKDMESALFGGNLSRRRLLKGAAALGGAYALDKFLPRSAEAQNGWQSYFKNLIISEQEAAQRKVPYIRQQFAVLNGNGQPTDLFVLRGVSDYQTGAAGVYRSKLVGQEFSQFQPMSELPLKDVSKAYSPDGKLVIATGSYLPPKRQYEVMAAAVSYNEGRNWYVSRVSEDDFKAFGSIFPGDIFPINGNKFLLSHSFGCLTLDINENLPHYARAKVKTVPGFSLRSTESISSLYPASTNTNNLSAGTVLDLYATTSNFRFLKYQVDLDRNEVIGSQVINYPPAGASVITNVYKENDVTKGLILVNVYSMQVFSYFDVQKNEGTLYDSNDWKDQFPGAEEIRIGDAVKVGDKFYVWGSVFIQGKFYGWLGEVSSAGFRKLTQDTDMTFGVFSIDTYTLGGTQVLDFLVDTVGKKITSLSGTDYVWASKGLDSAFPQEPPKVEKAFAPITQK